MKTLLRLYRDADIRAVTVFLVLHIAAAVTATMYVKMIGWLAVPIIAALMSLMTILTKGIINAPFGAATSKTVGRTDARMHRVTSRAISQDHKKS